MPLLISTVGVILVVGCGKEKSAVQSAASLDDLNRALAVLAMRDKAFPPATSNLANFLALSGKSMPIPPPGKTFVIDTEKRQFVVVDK